MSDKLATVDIKGKDYVMVNERIRAFRETFKGYRLTSQILSLENGICTMKAEVQDENGNVIATGHAQEKESSSFINKTSYIENCETSAWGRALGNLGIGIDTSIATYEEVANAVIQQKKPTKEDTKRMQEGQEQFDKMFSAEKEKEPEDKHLAMICKLLERLSESERIVLDYYKKKKLVDLTEAQKIEAIKILKTKQAKLAKQTKQA